MHWRTKHQLHKEWKTKALIGEPALRLAQRGRPNVPHQQITVRATLYVHQRMDTGNAFARLKWIEDYLVERGFVIDDAPEHFVYAESVSQVVDRKHQRVVVELEATPTTKELVQ